ncbi:hypothetical protein QBC44DRAFT_337302 [Cladorrhinum sp. PSN332]|nr:hypothetical protein QBC44DRAFT_337302 [Cladorrhinum sp. PSN332]
MDQEFLASLTPDQIEWIKENFASLDPPEGQTSDFENRGGNNGVAYGILSLCAVLSTLAVLLRVYSRLIVKRFKIEDVLFVAALGLFGGYIYENWQLAIFPGFYVHQWDVKVKYAAEFTYRTHLWSIFYGIVITLLKVGILLDWLNLFINPIHQRNAAFWGAHGLIWSIILFYGIGTIIEIFQCTPVEKIWDPFFVGGSCKINMKIHNYASAGVNLITDILIIALPQKIIWSLKMSKTKKIGVSMLFAIGLFACVVAIVRIFYLRNLLTSTDQVWHTSSLALWSAAEMTAGFLVMGIPSLPKVTRTMTNTASAEYLRSLFRSIGASLGGRSSRGGSEGSGGGDFSGGNFKTWPNLVTRTENDTVWAGPEGNGVAMLPLKSTETIGVHAVSTNSDRVTKKDEGHDAV